MDSGPEPSRIRRFVEAQTAQRKDTRVSDLESELEDEQRRSLRLSQQLMDETSLRCRAEKLADYRSVEIEKLKAENDELEKKISERTRRKPGVGKGGQRTGSGGEVPDGPQRVDGGTTPVRKSRAKPADISSDASPPGPAKRPSSSRKRGNVK